MCVCQVLYAISKLKDQINFYNINPHLIIFGINWNLNRGHFFSAALFKCHFIAFVVFKCIHFFRFYETIFASVGLIVMPAALDAGLRFPATLKLASQDISCSFMWVKGQSSYSFEKANYKSSCIEATYGSSII